jgi:hypothetical protein
MAPSTSTSIEHVAVTDDRISLLFPFEQVGTAEALDILDLGMSTFARSFIAIGGGACE